MIVGIIFFALGFVYLLEAIFPGFNVDFSIVWPIILIVVTLHSALKTKKFDLGNAIMFFIGIWFLILNNDYIYDKIHDFFWPILLMVMGILIVVNTITLKKKIKGLNFNKNKDGITCFYGIFGGCEETIKNPDFKGSNIYSVFGGCEIDFRQIEFSDKSVIITVYSIFGGTEIKVPRDCNIVLNSVAVLGGNVNKTTNVAKAGEKTIYINCVSVFGGTEIDN